MRNWSSELRAQLKRMLGAGIDDANQAGIETSSRDPGTKLAVMNVVHIIIRLPSTDTHNITEKVREKFAWARTAGSMIEHFGGFSSHDVLREGILNSPSNAFITSSAPHEAFNQLDMWLTPVKDEDHQIVPNTYDVGYYWGQEELPNLGIGLRPRIKFGSAQVGDQTIPPPDSRTIALHAVCAQIAHMSGAAGWLQEFFRETDEISVMIEPNAASELTRALRRMQMQPVSGSA